MSSEAHAAQEEASLRGTDARHCFLLWEGWSLLSACNAMDRDRRAEKGLTDTRAGAVYLTNRLLEMGMCLGRYLVVPVWAIGIGDREMKARAAVRPGSFGFSGPGRLNGALT